VERKKRWKDGIYLIACLYKNCVLLYVQYALCDENDDEEVEGEQNDYGCNVFFLFWISHIFGFFFEAFGGVLIMKKSMGLVEMMMEKKKQITKKVRSNPLVPSKVHAIFKIFVTPPSPPSFPSPS
jgi:hypothetical protein